ncbi:MAG TPA: ABC transporter ATP-binding protein [Deinococcales bacterium]|nr:ABC transporter ATP-binding protein [Deinococcales bacterium]
MSAPAVEAAGPALSARALRMRLGSREVLRGLNLDLLPGQLAVVIGPNGSGKSSLLAALAGLRPVEVGSTVSVLGQDARGLSRQALADRLAFLPARADVPFPLTVEELVLQGRPRPPAMRWALEALELEELRHKPMTRLSTGEARRAWLALALARRARVVLLDEPLSGLDPRYQLLLLRALRELVDAGASVTLVAHDLPYAAHADRVIALMAGEIVADGRPGDVLTGELLQKLYGVRVWLNAEPSSGALYPMPVQVV